MLLVEISIDILVMRRYFSNLGKDLAEHEHESVSAIQAEAEIVGAHISPEIKHNAEQVLASMGVSMFDAIPIFLNQVATRQGFPLELRNAKNLDKRTNTYSMLFSPSS